MPRRVLGLEWLLVRSVWAHPLVRLLAAQLVQPPPELVLVLLLPVRLLPVRQNPPRLVPVVLVVQCALVLGGSVVP